jgi:acetyl esterase/lipase
LGNFTTKACFFIGILNLASGHSPFHSKHTIMNRKSFKTLIALCFIFSLLGASEISRQLSTQASGWVCEIKTTVFPNGSILVQAVWVYGSSVPSSANTLATAVVAKGSCKLTDYKLSVGPSGALQNFSASVSPAHQALLRTQMINSGSFDPASDTIYYFQSNGPINYQVTDSLHVSFTFENGYPVEGNLVSGTTNLQDLNNGFPLDDFDLLTDTFSLNSTRYFNKIFADVQVTPDLDYAQNISILSGMPTLDSLKMDVYEPAGDTVSLRPLIIFMHPGEYLPYPQNSRTSGTRKDSAVVELSRQMAQRGFVVASISYRLGWSPVSSLAVEIRRSYLNAHYRGIQDARTAIRFFRKNVSLAGNTFKIDTSRIALGGMGVGGSIALGAASLDKYAELSLPKFMDPNSQTSFVDTSLSGDLWGTNDRQLNRANHPGYSSDFDATFTLGGFVLDSSWIEAGDVPIVALQCSDDPVNPFGYGPILAHNVGQVNFYVSGSEGAVSRSLRIGNQSRLTESAFLDRYSYVAAEKNDSVEGLYPFFTLAWENAPWQWWDTTDPNHAFASMFNPNMSKSKALSYIDTATYYASQRLICALQLEGCQKLVDISLEAKQHDVSTSPHLIVYPIPTHGLLFFQSKESIKEVSVFDCNGKVIFRQIGLLGTKGQLDTSEFPKSIYFLSVRFSRNRIEHHRFIVN